MISVSNKRNDRYKPLQKNVPTTLIIGEDETLLESLKGKDARLVSLVGDPQGQTWKVMTKTLISSLSLSLSICFPFQSLPREVRRPSGDKQGR